MKNAGVLMPIASLPSPYLVGDFGPQAYKFADMIRKAGYDLWQMLPLNTVGFGNSPYQCFSSKAIDPMYISVDLLRKDGLIRKQYPKKETDTIDYMAAKQLKNEMLKEAFGRFKPNEEYREFIKQPWVRKYAVFIAFKELHGNSCWNTWPDEYKNYPLTGDEKLAESNSEAIDFQMFVQYELFRQFGMLKKYVNDLGLTIIGDIPFYVGIDSDDVYYNREYFELDSDGRPVWIAGVPPDYFNDLGQRWGNPLYKWDLLQKNDYSLWFDRITANAGIFDILRIDHFRAFDTYWKISEKEETAVNGEWIENCGEDFFNTLFKKYPDIKIVAEDLGDLRPEVHQLRDKFNLMGMKIMQFTFMEPEKVRELCYIGTHDNDSLISWYRSESRETRKRIRKIVSKKYPHDKIYDAIMKYTLGLKNQFVILTVNDITLDDRRINLPGTIGSPNWEYKIRNFRSLAQRLKVIRGERS